MTPMVFLSFLLFLLLSSSVGALTIHTSNNSSTSLPSHYTTIGFYPSVSQFYNITVVKSDQVHMHTFNPSLSSAGMIENHLVVFVGDAPINAAFLAVDAQRYGAAALILKKMDDFRGGRGVAFKTPVSIPVVVVSGATMDELVSNAPSISSIELTAISPEEKSIIRRMQTEISAIRILVIIIYCFLTPFFIYLFVFEVIFVYKNKQRYFSHNCMMKLVAVFTAVLWLLWMAVDPMAMKAKTDWNELLMVYLAGGFLLALYLLILRILVSIVGSSYFSSWHKVFISRLLYFLAGFFIVLFILFALVWNTPTIIAVFKFFLCSSVLVVGISFAIVGKLMMDTLMVSGNRSKKANVIIARLTGFIAYYGIASVLLLGVVHGYLRNVIYTTYACALLHSVGLVVTFLLLFLRFPSQMHKSRRSKFYSASKTPSSRHLATDSFSSSGSMSPSTETLSSNYESTSSVESPHHSPLSEALAANNVQLDNFK